jgi:hypothetical protein
MRLMCSETLHYKIIIFLACHLLQLKKNAIKHLDSLHLLLAYSEQIYISFNMIKP